MQQQLAVQANMHRWWHPGKLRSLCGPSQTLKELTRHFQNNENEEKSLLATSLEYFTYAKKFDEPAIG